MNRKQAILSLFAASASIGLASYSGWHVYQVKKRPLLSDLELNIKMIAELVDLIIPTTETPGAKDLDVHSFIVLIIKKASSKKDQNNFINGLNDLTRFCKDNYDNHFEKCSYADKVNALKYFESKSSYSGIIGKIRNKLLGQPFYSILKKLTIEGYCTSEVGATQFLEYQFVPGKYIANIDLTENQKTWATK